MDGNFEEPYTWTNPGTAVHDFVTTIDNDADKLVTPLKLALVTSSGNINLSTLTIQTTPINRPTFGGQTIDDITQEIFTDMSYVFPAATGGTGELTYSISGITGTFAISSTFTESTRTFRIHIPTTNSLGVHNGVYTVTDENNESASLHFPWSRSSTAVGS